MKQVTHKIRKSRTSFSSLSVLLKRAPRLCVFVCVVPTPFPASIFGIFFSLFALSTAFSLGLSRTHTTQRRSFVRFFDAVAVVVVGCVVVVADVIPERRTLLLLLLLLCFLRSLCARLGYLFCLLFLLLLPRFFCVGLFYSFGCV